MSIISRHLENQRILIYCYSNFLCPYQMRHNVHRILDRKEDVVQKYRQERKMNQKLIERVLFTKGKSTKCGYK